MLAGQKLVGIASQPVPGVDVPGAGQGENSNENRERVLMHVGGGVKRCLAIEEGEEGEEDSEGEDRGEGGGGREEESQHVEDPEQLQSPCQPEGREEEGGTEEEGRHLRATKEWEQIDQVRCRVIYLCVTSLCTPNSCYALLEHIARVYLRNVGSTMFLTFSF